MSFAQPLWLASLVVLVPFVLALHAQRRRDLPVASLVVWRRVPATSTAAPQRRRVPWRDPRLWLQLVVVTLAAVALARPMVGDRGPAAHWVVVIDASTSMNAVDLEPNRFSAAVAEVRKRWATPAAGGLVSVVEASASPRVVAARWAAGAQLAPLLETLTASEADADWPAVAERVRALIVPGDAASVVVFTDAYGAEPVKTALAAVGIGTDSTAVVVLGDALVNVGIGEVGAVLRGDRPDQWTVRGRVSTVGLAAGDAVRVVASYRPFGGDTFLPWGGVDVTLESDGSGVFEVPLDLPGPGEVELRGPSGDRLPADDHAVLALRGEPVRVVIVGSAKPALLRALAAIGGLEVFLTEGVPGPSDAAAFDLAIVTEDVDGVPATSTLWFGAVPAGVDDGAAWTEPLPPLTTGTHVLARDLDAESLGLTRAVPLRRLEGATPLLSAGDATLAWARTTAVGRQVVLGFGLDDGVWSAQLGFPTFLAALVEWAAPRTWSHVPGGCVVGQSCPWPRDAFAQGWVLLDPTGTEVQRPTTLRPVEGDPLASEVWEEAWFDAGFVPRRAGYYELVFDNGRVGLPVAPLPIGGSPEATSDGVAEPAAGPPRDLGRWLALLALGLVAVDVFAAGLRRAVGPRRRPWRTVAAAGVTLVAWSMAVVDAPLRLPEAGGDAVWVGPSGAIDEAHDLQRASPGWRWSGIELQGIGGSAVGPASGAGEGPALTAGDVVTGLELAMALPGRASARRVVIASDAVRTLTAADAVALAHRATADGTLVDVVASGAGPVSPTADGAQGSLDAAGAADDDAAAASHVTLEQLVVPDDVRAGARFTLRAVVNAPAGVAWRWRAELVDTTGAAPVAVESESGLEATAVAEGGSIGPGIAEIDLEAGAPGELRYRLTVRHEGNLATEVETSVSVPVGPRLRVLMIATDELQGARLAEGLAVQAIDVDRVIPFRMPSSLEALSAYDAVALVNVRAQELFTAYQELLQAYVRDVGGGLVIFGGPSAYGPGGYFRTPLEDVSPLSAQITDEAPEVAMAFVLDRSGSMNGAVASSTRMDVAKVATMEALQLLGERSLAAIIVFDTEAQVLLPLQPVADEAAFQDALASVNAAGGTSIFPGLVAAYELMQGSTSATRHVVVMTDGLSQEGDFATVLGALGELGVSTSFVGVGDAADRRQLASMANISGGALHMALDFRALPGILAQEAMMLSAQPIEERPTQGDWVAGSAPAFLEGVVSGSPPPLSGYVRTTAKDEAVVHLVERNEDDPLLASWRYGLGRVVAFASEVDGPWATAWTSAPEFARLWSQTIRWIAERPVRATGTLQVAGSDGVLDVLVSVPPEATEEDAARARVEVVADDGATWSATLPLRLVAPGRAAARFEIASGWSGTVGLRVTAEPALGIDAPRERSFDWPLPPTQAVRTDTVPLDLVAAVTGGVVMPLDGARLPAVAPRWAWRSMPEVWWLLGLLAYLVALVVRYGAASAWSAQFRERRAARTRTASPAR